MIVHGRKSKVAYWCNDVQMSLKRVPKNIYTSPSKTYKTLKGETLLELIRLTQYLSNVRV